MSRAVAKRAVHQYTVGMVQHHPLSVFCFERGIRKADFAKRMGCGKSMFSMVTKGSRHFGDRLAAAAVALTGGVVTVDQLADWGKGD